MKCHQRKIREQQARFYPKSTIPLQGCYVGWLDKKTTKEIIIQYEWLGTMGKADYCVGLFSPDEEPLGVVCFGRANGTRSHNICGDEHRHLAICLERGACVHYAHQHAGSFLVSQACKWMARHTQYRIFFAYSDQEAGEVGTIYQACNWIYQGISPGRHDKSRPVITDWETGEEFTARIARRRGLYMTDIYNNPRYTVRNQRGKGKYVWFEGSRSEKRYFRNQMVHPECPYPKRHFIEEVTSATCQG